MDRILMEAEKIQEWIVAHRRWLHANAETGFDLFKTKAYVRRVLEELGYSVRECGKAGLVTTVGKPNGKVFLLRADMDALPINEDADCEFRCETGAMHACGHDMHTAMLLGAARILKEREQTLPGMVKLMFQPAEETFEGSRDMIENGILENPKPDAAMMIHVATGIPLPAGTLVVSSPGVSAPAADYFSIRVQGKGCHGSAPQQGIDPITAGAHIILALQEIQARELAATDEAVITIGAFHAGDAGNVIPDSAELSGTIRTYNEKTRNFIKDRIGQISRGIAAAFRAEATVVFGSGCPSLYNDPVLSTKATKWLQEYLNAVSVFTTEQLSGGKPSRGGGSEDFAYISQEIPSVMVALAAGEPEKGYHYPLHHPKVSLEESALSAGTAAFICCALNFLKSGR